MTDEHNNDELTPEAPHTPGDDLPEPPPSWKSNDSNFVQPYDIQTVDDKGDNLPPQSDRFQNSTIGITNTDKLLLESARKYISICQVCAVVSIFIGGVLLSSIAVIFSVMALFKLNNFSAAHSLDQQARRALKRPAYFAIGLGILALVFNAVSLILIYPMVMQGLQAGDLSGIFGSGQGGSSPASGSSTWG